MKIYISIFLFFLFGLSVFGQDIVYDSIAGNKSNWFHIKVGPLEKTVGIKYENQASLIKSKVLAAAGLLDGMTKGIDYKDYRFSYDTMTYEFSTDVPINMIVYKYILDDGTPLFFVGLRKASLGESMFEGQYMFISPLVVLDSEVKIFQGVGTNRSLFLSLKPPNLTDNSITDYQLSNKVTIQGIKVSRVLRASKTRDILTGIHDENIYVIRSWPNPVSFDFHIEIFNNRGVVIRIFNDQPKLIYENRTSNDETTINVSSYSSGIYFIVITDEPIENIISTIKMIKK